MTLGFKAGAVAGRNSAAPASRTAIKLPVMNSHNRPGPAVGVGRPSINFRLRADIGWPICKRQSSGSQVSLNARASGRSNCHAFAGAMRVAAPPTRQMTFERAIAVRAARRAGLRGLLRLG